MREKGVTNTNFGPSQLHNQITSTMLCHLAAPCLTLIPGFTFTVVDEFRRFLSQFSINFHEILHTLFSIHVVTTLKVSRSFDKYLKS